MKKILPLMIISMLLTACAGKKVVYESADAFQKVSASIETMEVKKNEKTNSTIFHIQTKITNGSDLDLSQVDYQFDCYDRDGNLVCTLPEIVNSGDLESAKRDLKSENTGKEEQTDNTDNKAKLLRFV